MVYIILTIAGWIAVIIVKKEWSEAKQVLFILSVLLAGMLGYLAVDFLVLEEGQVISKGVGEVLANLPWEDIGMFFSMLVGMASKYLFDVIGEKKRRRIAFNKWQFLKPFLVSPIIFGTILSQVPDKMHRRF
ncbi:MAG: hypothetical protein GTN53_44295 [Candidatus Aminicenantes bacterium]|nr:hypothetical protein [Candidatus Aminicenantes bacterium]NIQ73461.1 hypothetical protein [Candidatus Aminicenantes bacterium]NIT29530.1 hypothetical protein [Candidatus Aminicenantes bacterium]